MNKSAGSSVAESLASRRKSAERPDDSGSNPDRRIQKIMEEQKQTEKKGENPVTEDLQGKQGKF